MIGRTLAGRYTIDALIARRGSGTAYRAADGAAVAGSGRAVALTVLDQAVAKDAAVVHRLRQAAELLRYLDHPALDAPLHVGQDADLTFVVSRHRPGRSLAGLVGRSPDAGWPLRSVLPVGYRIADALAHAHAAGLVHGALEPASILMTADDEVVVLDFAIASALSEADAEPRDDVLGLARVTLALLSDGRSADGTGQAPRRPAGLREPAWAGLLEGLASDPALRPATPEALMVSLEDPGWFRRLVGRRGR